MANSRIMDQRGKSLFTHEMMAVPGSCYLYHESWTRQNLTGFEEAKKDRKKPYSTILKIFTMVCIIVDGGN